MLDHSFVAIVRRHLPLLDHGEELTPESNLAQLGLDSMGTAHLVVDLEDGLGISLPSSALVPSTFGSLASLWREVCKLKGP
ncbi:MAG: acyl carrier protein [Myxococcales bacterium]|jgi:nodulation protein F|nr:acyl carrier protein [Myxococcales bacterium]HRC58358.1 acyl carrier protein [Kofleriaceae bacterium]